MKYIIVSVMAAIMFSTSMAGAAYSVMASTMDTIDMADDIEETEGIIIIPEEMLPDTDSQDVPQSNDMEDIPTEENPEPAVTDDEDIEEVVMVTDELLYKTVQAEASNQGLYGKQLVASVIVNRVNSTEFPDTIHDVVYEPSQFEVASNGALKKAVPDEETIAAVNSVIASGVVTDATYFRKGQSGWHERNLTKLFTYEAHTFYKA